MEYYRSVLHVFPSATVAEIRCRCWFVRILERLGAQVFSCDRGPWFWEDLSRCQPEAWPGSTNLSTCHSAWVLQLRRILHLVCLESTTFGFIVLPVDMKLVKNHCDWHVLQLVFISKFSLIISILPFGKKESSQTPRSNLYSQDFTGETRKGIPQVAAEAQWQCSGLPQTLASRMITAKHCRFAGNTVCYLHRVGRVSGPALFAPWKWWWKMVKNHTDNAGCRSRKQIEMMFKHVYINTYIWSIFETRTRGVKSKHGLLKNPHSSMIPQAINLYQGHTCGQQISGGSAVTGFDGPRMIILWILWQSQMATENPHKKAF